VVRFPELRRNREKAGPNMNDRSPSGGEDPPGRSLARSTAELFPVVYEELRGLAVLYFKNEQPGHTLQPTALVHEAYLRLVRQERVSWQNRAHFFSVAAQMMRRILIDYAKGHRRGKRFGGAVRVTLDDRVGAVRPLDCELLVLNQALDELTTIDARQGQIVELRYFGGLSEREVAEILAISRSTVTREWQIARGWLYRRVTTGRPQDFK
jgi:RNA polymerase sigma-70 factor (ECF subfamily)